jgi:4-amino-4-deoxy-L-arabinose transferase-like glycosyltransferase
MQKGYLRKFNWVIIPLLFLLYSSPGALDYLFHFPDEKYYTDAVLQMMDKNDCFTPYSADGSPRFLKPIATYWVLIGSYKVLGVSKFSSRLLFWLAGALLVIVVFFMAKSLTQNRKLASTAAFVTAANPLVLMSASRSIPDILLVLFLTISVWGFLEIMLRGNPPPKYYWMAYLGAALAFETKGLPAAAFAGASVLFLLLNPWKRKKIREIIHWPAIIISVAIALSWFVIMYIEHGTTYLESFYTDQVGGRVSSKPGQVITNTLLGIVNLVAFSLPWIIIAFSKPKKLKAFISGSGKEAKAILGFIATWVVLIIIMSGAVFKFYDRYLLPVIPLVALFFAWIATQAETRFQKPVLKIFLTLTLVTFVINLLYAVFIFPDRTLVAGTAVSAVFIALYFAGGFKNSPAEIVLANGILLLYFNVLVLLYPVLMPNPGEQMVDALNAEGVANDQKVYVYGNIRTASNIRIHCHHEFDVVSMDTVYTLPAEPRHFLVFTEKEQKYLDLKSYEIFNYSQGWSRVPAEKFPELLKDAVIKLKEGRTKYFIAKPKSNKNDH